MNYLKENGLDLALYLLFAFVCTVSGVGVLDNPLGFLSLLGILLVVDIRSFKRGLYK